ncbi:hypothetical protein CPC735_057070 [Paecilomyces variotii No. 5]|uniref:Uncharacterized protein n=1 Tax=Byssochlamys spectabilis (strain No. 5 / NBRC 109023) TaxID=1356009 RepID=V5I3U0_BYSSN|nr:hypothetical protein CPC735_057070 [Paecilomyces variotii No. 5]
MASENPSLGLFSRLPYEIREPIWKEFFPTSRHQHPLMTQRQKTDLSILRASRALYDEISRLLYENTSLTFSLAPTHQNSGSWAVVALKQSKKHSYGEYNSAQPIWCLESLQDAKSRGFDNLPFHKIQTVTVKLYAPNPEKKVETFFQWRKIADLVPLFKKARHIRSLTVWFQKGIDGDWFSQWTYLHKSPFFLIKRRRGGPDVFFLPFYTLRNVGEMSIEAHSTELKNAINWQTSKVSMDAAQDKGGKSVPSFKIFGYDVDRAVADDYLVMHLYLWRYLEGPEANLARRDFLSTWYEQGSSGKSEFESQILRITAEYPEVVKAYDPQMDVLDDMHTTMVCLYLHMKSLRGNLEDPEYWDQGMWSSTFPQGIPAMNSDEYWEEIESKLVDVDLYRKYMDKNTFLSTIDNLIGQWEHDHPSMDEKTAFLHLDTDDDSDNDSVLSRPFSCERCPDYDSELDDLWYSK